MHIMDILIQNLFNETVHVREAISRNPAFSATTQHSAFNVANKLAKNPLRIHIYEQILVTGHLDAHPHAHSDHVFLTDIIFLGKQKWNWKFWNMGFLQNTPILVIVSNFCKIQSHLGENRGSLKQYFPENVVGRFLNLELVVTTEKIGGFNFILLN